LAALDPGTWQLSPCAAPDLIVEPLSLVAFVHGLRGADRAPGTFRPAVLDQRAFRHAEELSWRHQRSSGTP